MTVSKIERGQRSEGSGRNEIDYNSLKMWYRTVCTIELERIYTNGPHWRRFALFRCFFLVSFHVGRVACSSSGFVIARSLVRISAATALHHQDQLSLPSFRGRLMSSSRMYAFYGSTLWQRCDRGHYETEINAATSEIVCERITSWTADFTILPIPLVQCKIVQQPRPFLARKHFSSIFLPTDMLLCVKPDPVFTHKSFGHTHNVFLWSTAFKK